MEKLISADCLMKKFEIKRPQFGFNGAVEVGIGLMNIIPFHSSMTSRQLIIHLFSTSTNAWFLRME